MKNIKTRLISLTLIMIMCLTLINITVLAAEAPAISFVNFGIDGTSITPVVAFDQAVTCYIIIYPKADPAPDAAAIKAQGPAAAKTFGYIPGDGTFGPTLIGLSPETEYTAYAVAVARDGATDSNVISRDFKTGVDRAPSLPPSGTGPLSASLSPSVADFNKNTASVEYRDIAVTLTRGSYSLLALKNGSYTLKQDTDYTADGNVYTIKKEYLAALPTGAQRITFDMSGGSDPILSIAVFDLNYDLLSDVTKDDWFYADVVYVLQNKLFNGTSEMTFSPSLPMTRAMLVTVLWRLDGSLEVEEVLIHSDFADIVQGSYYELAVGWAAKIGLINGYGAGFFGPDDSVTREQLAALLWRYAKYKEIDVSSGENTNILSYEDAFDISEYAMSALQWTCAEGITVGKPGGFLDPQGLTTRAEAAAALHRFCEAIK